MKMKRSPGRTALLPAMALAFCIAATLPLAAQAGGAVYQLSELNIAPGSSAAELNFAWLSSAQTKKPAVQIARKADQQGAAFPAAKARSFTGSSSKAFATDFYANDKTVDAGSYSNKVTVSGLAPSTEYLYRVGDGSSWSAVYTVTTRDPSSFGFIAVGDPQVGAKSSGPKTLEADKANWQDTLDKSTFSYPASSFLLCLGDEVNDYNKLSVQDEEYAAFFSPDELRSLPMATVDGNHDFAMGEYYGYHYNQPNVSAQYGATYGNDGDYWFTYGNALFLVLNSNAESVQTHDLFIRGAVAKNPKATWRIACFHHSLYSEADHFADPDIVDRRASYPAVLERYGIDVVLQGHDHAYTRTLPMAKGKPVAGADPAAARIENPAGIVYFTLDSGSGSKFYEWHDPSPESFSAVRWQGKVPTFSYVSVSDKEFSLTTYRTDDMSIIDDYTIVKK